jgi:6-phosphogluconolactonase (cycloisomerase 2 family)
MKRHLKCFQAALLVLLGFALLSASVYGQDEGGTFVFVNNDNFGPNTVSAFSVMAGGTLMMVPSSPFATGGTGGGAGFYASHRITTATVRRNFLFVANGGSNNISVFKIDTDTGALTLVGVFPTGGSADGLGISLAATPNGRYLYAGNGGSSNISQFRIASNGSLVPIAPPVPAGGLPDGMKVTPNGNFLGVALPISDSVAMFRIASNGTLMSVPSSPFAAGGSGGATDVEISCKSNFLFDPKFGGGTTVAVFNIAANGGLSAIAGSPFTFAPGSNSNVGVLTPDGQHLEVSNQASNTITVLDVAAGGSLTQETDSPSGASPFANLGGDVPQSEGTNREGDLLYVSNDNAVVTGFHIDSDGGLSPVTGSPFPTGGTGLDPSLTVFPAHKDEGEGDEADDSGRKGHYDFEADHGCEDSGEMNYEDDSGHKMNGKVSAVAVNGNTAVISGPGTLADGTPVQYTAIALGNSPVVGLNRFAISWITSTGSVFQTAGALTNGYIAVHQ